MLFRSHFPGILQKPVIQPLAMLDYMPDTGTAPPRVLTTDAEIFTDFVKRAHTSALACVQDYLPPIARFLRKGRNSAFWIQRNGRYSSALGGKWSGQRLIDGFLYLRFVTAPVAARWNLCLRSVQNLRDLRYPCNQNPSRYFMLSMGHLLSAKSRHGPFPWLPRPSGCHRGHFL